MNSLVERLHLHRLDATPLHVWQDLHDAGVALQALREERDTLRNAARELIRLIEDVGKETEWADQEETDRVFAWYEFDDLRKAVAND